MKLAESMGACDARALCWNSALTHRRVSSKGWGFGKGAYKSRRGSGVLTQPNNAQISCKSLLGRLKKPLCQVLVVVMFFSMSTERRDQGY